MSLVASTMRAQKSNTLLASPFDAPGNFAGSGSSPTHSVESLRREAACRVSVNRIVGVLGVVVGRMEKRGPEAASSSELDLGGQLRADAGVAARRHRQQPRLLV